MERKLDNKLEKLEHKTLKIKEKKMALLRSSDSDVGHSSRKSRPIGVPANEAEFLMDATVLGQRHSTIPHMSGGETYKQEWEVVNSGELSWTDDVSGMSFN